MELNEIPRYRIGPHDFGYTSPAPMLRIERVASLIRPKVSKTLRRFPSVPISPMRGRTRVSIPAEDKERTTSFLEPGGGGGTTSR